MLGVKQTAGTWQPFMNCALTGMDQWVAVNVQTSIRLSRIGHGLARLTDQMARFMSEDQPRFKATLHETLT